ncbi:transposase, partial [Acinetobacter baumannii]
EATLSPRSREFLGCSFWEVWQVQHEQKKIKAAQDLKTNKSQAYLEEHIESIIARADSKKPSTSSKKQRLTDLRKNKQAEKDSERLKQRN